MKTVRNAFSKTRFFLRRQLRNFENMTLVSRQREHFRDFWWCFNFDLDEFHKQHMTTSEEKTRWAAKVVRSHFAAASGILEMMILLLHKVYQYPEFRVYGAQIYLDSRSWYYVHIFSFSFSEDNRKRAVSPDFIPLPSICMHMCTLMMIAFITIKSSLVPLIEGLCAQIYFRFEISVVCSHLLLFFLWKKKHVKRKQKGS